MFLSIATVANPAIFDLQPLTQVIGALLYTHCYECLAFTKNIIWVGLQTTPLWYTLASIVLIRIFIIRHCAALASTTNNLHNKSNN